MTLRILIVDDEPLIAHNLQSYLEDEGMEVTSVGSAEQALSFVKRGATFDVCVMDLRLPGAHGDVGILTLHRIDPRLRFIIHTGSSNYVISDELRDLGIEDRQLFRKPLSDMGLLARTVRDLGDR